MKEFFKPFREKEENYYQFAHEVDLVTCFKFATEILIIRQLARNFKKITKHLFEQSNHPHIKMEKFIPI
jgi:hypothetical protein